MGIEDINSRRRLEMSKILTLSHISLEKQHVEYNRKIEQPTSLLSEENLQILRRLDTSLLNQQLEINEIAIPSLQKISIWKKFLCRVSDIPAIYLLSLIANIGDISHFNTATKLWAYCGMHNYKVEVNLGRRWFSTMQRATDYVTSVIRINGDFNDMEDTAAFQKEIEDRLKLCVWGSEYHCEKISAKKNPIKLVNWNTFLRDLCWYIGQSITKGNGFYHSLHIEMVSEKISYLRNVNEADIRIAELQSARHITKLFLIHVVQYWRQLEGLTTKAPLEGRKGCIEFPGMPIIYSEETKKW